MAPQARGPLKLGPDACSSPEEHERCDRPAERAAASRTIRAITPSPAMPAGMDADAADTKRHFPPAAFEAPLRFSGSSNDEALRGVSGLPTIEICTALRAPSSLGWITAFMAHAASSSP